MSVTNPLQMFLHCYQLLPLFDVWKCSKIPESHAGNYLPISTNKRNIATQMGSKGQKKA